MIASGSGFFEVKQPPSINLSFNLPIPIHLPIQIGEQEGLNTTAFLSELKSSMQSKKVTPNSPQHSII